MQKANNRFVLCAVTAPSAPNRLSTRWTVDDYYEFEPFSRGAHLITDIPLGSCVLKVVDQEDDVFLVYRVTGLQEKVGFFEAYRGKPTFDRCSKSSVNPLAMQPYEPSEGMLKAVELNGDHLKVVYTHKQSEAVHPEAARLVVK